MRETSPMREDLQATLDARRDLGPEYETALVDSLVERIDETIAARVQAELKQHGSAPRKHHKPNGAAIIPVALGSMGLGIPLTGIGAANAGLAGLLVVWVAIVVINIAAAAAIIRRP